eukprot:scaffold376895_cov35-Prasinocladus_malaysianus.AAC.1
MPPPRLVHQHSAGNSATDVWGLAYGAKQGPVVKNRSHHQTEGPITTGDPHAMDTDLASPKHTRRGHLLHICYICFQVTLP